MPLLGKKPDPKEQVRSIPRQCITRLYVGDVYGEVHKYSHVCMMDDCRLTRRTVSDTGPRMAGEAEEGTTRHRQTN